MVRLAKHLSAIRADVVQANGGDTVKWAALAAWVSPGRCWRLVYRNIGDPHIWLADPLRRAFYRHVVWRKIDGVVSVSEHTRAALQSSYGNDRGRIEVIYQGVNEDALASQRQAPDVRGSLLTPATTQVVVWVGAMSREKRPDRALRAIAALREQGQDLVLWMIGDGPIRVGAEALSRELGLTGVVRWIGAVKDIGTYLHAADVFLLTSDTEGIPGALLEAMTVGLPSVTTRVGGIHEVLDDAMSGFTVEPEDEEGLAARLRQLIQDSELRSALGAHAQRVARERFSMDVCVDSYLRFYRSILESDTCKPRLD